METSRYNYYDILEVSPHCAQHEVTQAYERARNTYSGENPAIYTIFSHDEARELLKMIEEAYSVLGNKTLRSLYDERIAHATYRPDEVSFQTLKSLSQIVIPESTKSLNQKIDFKEDPAFEKEIKEQKEWDGDFLRRVREYKGISLERMSETTKISAYYISSVERMDTSSLPAPVFVRGYVNQISKVLGLDDKLVCETYMKKYKDVLGKK